MTSALASPLFCKRTCSTGFLCSIVTTYSSYVLSQSLLLPAVSLFLIALKHRLCCRSCWQINIGFRAFSCGLSLITSLVLEGIQSNRAQAHAGLQGTSRGDGKRHFPVLPSSGTRMELITLPSALLCSWWPRSQCWGRSE